MSVPPQPCALPCGAGQGIAGQGHLRAGLCQSGAVQHMTEPLDSLLPCPALPCPALPCPAWKWPCPAPPRPPLPQPALPRSPHPALHKGFAVHCQISTRDRELRCNRVALAYSASNILSVRLHPSSCNLPMKARGRVRRNMTAALGTGEDWWRCSSSGTVNSTGYWSGCGHCCCIGKHSSNHNR